MCGWVCAETFWSYLPLLPINSSLAEPPTPEQRSRRALPTAGVLTATGGLHVVLGPRSVQKVTQQTHADLFAVCETKHNTEICANTLSSRFSYIVCTSILLVIFFSVISHFLQQFLHRFLIFLKIFRVLLPHLVDKKLGDLWRNEIKFGEGREVAAF